VSGKVPSIKTLLDEAIQTVTTIRETKCLKMLILAFHFLETVWKRKWLGERLLWSKSSKWF